MFAPGNLGKGDFNVYRMFVESALALTRRNGWTSQIVPEGLYNGANCMAIRRALYETCRLNCLLGFENTNEAWFPGVHTAMKFCLYAAHVGGQTESVRAAFNIRSQDQLADVKAGRSLNIPVRLIKEFSPDALAIMEFGSQLDIDIAAKMYRWRAFGDKTAGRPRRVYMREIDMGTDRGLFDEDSTGIPLYEGRMVDQFDYCAKGYRNGRGRAARWEDLPFSRPEKSIQPQWYIPRERVPEKCVERMANYRIGFCDVASPTNERTLVASLIPAGVLCGHSVPTILFEADNEDWHYPFWISVANSYAIDFVARMKVSLHMTFSILDSLPFPGLERHDPRVSALVSRCLRLSCTGPEMTPFWNQLAADGWVPATTSPTQIPGELEEEARLQIRAEIDATVAHDVFELTRSEVEYILSTFPTQQRHQEEKYGEFRSRRVILEIYDAMQESICTGQPYETRLDLPSAALRVPHPPLETTTRVPVIPGILLPFRRVRPRREERYQTCVPLLSLKAAAGSFGEEQPVEFEDWVEIKSSHQLRKGMFVAQVVGHSMEPLISDGAYCLFRYPVLGTRQDRIVVVEHHDIHDPETGGTYTVKRYRSEKAPSSEGSWHHIRIVLEPLNPAFSPIVLTEESEGQVRVIAEFIEVLEPDEG